MTELGWDERAQVRIVIADDEPTIRAALGELLADAGYQVVGSAADGKSALDLIDSLHPAVAILDHQMPQMTGIEVASDLKERGSPVRVIVLSACDDTGLQVIAEKVAVDAYLVKGCSSRDIFASVDRAVRALG